VTITGLRYCELEFGQHGELQEYADLQKAASAEATQDLVIFSHGWNASPTSARALYAGMFELIGGMLPAARRATTTAAGVLWPSLLFPEDEPAADGPDVSTQAATQSLGTASRTQPILPPRLSSGSELADALTPAFPGHAQHLRTVGELLDAQPQDGHSLRQFHELVKLLVTSPNDAEEDSGESRTLTRPTSEVLETLAGLAPSGAGYAQSGNPFKLLWAGARELLRTASYLEMKNRAGVIGRVGLGPLLTRLHGANPDMRVHLMGHSFGARLVAFSLTGLPFRMIGPASPVKSLVLIQGAFSHFSFAPDAPIASRAGALAKFNDRVDGPLLCTYSTADRAVGWWYPNASRLARDDRQGIAAFNYRWGGMGYDGFQQGLVETARLQEPGSEYGFQPAHFYRLDARHVIKRNLSWFAGAHSDICHPEVAWAVASAARLQSADH
jgi:hypothetical protein